MTRIIREPDELGIARQPAIAADPGQGSFDDPAARSAPRLIGGTGSAATPLR
jgi:hypothetical protein